MQAKRASGLGLVLLGAAAVAGWLQPPVPPRSIAVQVEAEGGPRVAILAGIVLVIAGIARIAGRDWAPLLVPGAAGALLSLGLFFAFGGAGVDLETGAARGVQLVYMASALTGAALAATTAPATARALEGV